MEQNNMEQDNIDHLLEQLITAAKAELEFCNEEHTPNICAMINTPAGLDKIVQLICEYVGNYSMSISDAIVAIERERSSNLNELG